MCRRVVDPQMIWKLGLFLCVPLSNRVRSYCRFHLTIKWIIQGASVKPVTTFGQFHANTNDPSKPSGFLRTARFNIQKSYVLYTQFINNLYGSENKQRLFLYTALTDCFYNRDGVSLLRGTDWVFIYNSTFCPHSVFMCFVWIWEQTAIISLYSINWLVFITETKCVYCSVRT